ncbi:hypothetical protein Q6375_01665 [Clostridium septicum]|uniref:hypothetical protein n=1 Tax=Clostridium septicum TaxID=1504 RepID=UPI00272E73FD|nr:hypothetical protein [Clostridium septicum]WLF69755.1 hypothetical protein Q6375_01665 [Clostridium septicum]
MNKKMAIILTMTTILTMTSGLTTNKIFASELKTENSKLIEVQEGQNGSGGGQAPVLPTNNVQSKKVIITKVTPSKSVISPGEEFSLTYRIENISGGKIDGLSLKLVGVEGKSGLDGFTAVGTTNEIYVGSIAYNDVKEVTIKLVSDPALKTGAYNFVTSVMYSQYGSEQEEITKLSGIVLRSVPEIAINGVETFANQGGSNLTGTLANDSKVKVKNVLVKAKIGDNTYNYSAGNIEAEGEAMFEISIKPVEVDTQGEVEVTYEDVSGNKYTSKGNFMVKPMITEGTEDANSNVKKSGTIMSFLKKLFRVGI